MTQKTVTRSISTPTASNDWPRDALPRDWVEALFTRMSAFYGSKFADLWRGVEVAVIHRTWAIELGGLTKNELRQGSAALVTRQWPPTLPEFVALCRPPVNIDAALTEAITQMPLRMSGVDTWSDPAIYWAASRIGFHDFTHLSRNDLRSRFAAALEEVKRQPTIAQVPPHFPSLPDVGNGVTDSETARRNLSRIKAMLAGTGVVINPGAWH